jgi:hypothetical protein
VHADLLTSRSRFFAKALKNYAQRKQSPGTANPGVAEQRDEDTAIEKSATAADGEQPNVTGQTESNTESMNQGDDSIKWREGEEGVVKFPVDKPDLFAQYVQLLYTGALAIYDGPVIDLEAAKKKRRKHGRDVQGRHRVI